MKKIYYLILKWWRSHTIKNKTISIISNNCWGGFMYQSCGLGYNSPFIGLYMYAPEYIRMLQNITENLKQPIKFINQGQSKYKDLYSDKFIIGTLGDTGIEIVFMHYKTEEEVLCKWNRRLKRLDFNNLIVKFSDTDECTDELIKEFDNMPFKNKVCFTSKPFPECKSVIAMKEFANDKNVKYEWAYSQKYYKFVYEANKLLSK